MSELGPKDTVFYVYRDDNDLWPSYIIVAEDNENEALKILKAHLRQKLEPNSNKIISLLRQCDMYKIVKVGKVDLENGGIFTL